MKGAALVSVICGVGLGGASAAPGTKADDGPKLEHKGTTTEPADATIDIAKLDAAIAKTDAAMIACYKKALARDNSLGNTGTEIRIELSLQPSGAMKDIDVYGVEEAMNKCIAAAAAKWKLGKTKATRPIQISHVMELYIGVKVENPDVSFGVVGGMPAEATGGWGTIGQGTYGTIGGPTPTGTGRSSGPTITLADVTASTGLDVEIVRRFIKREMARVSYCYEKQLLVDTTLAGTLTATFEINSAGTVTTANATGLKSKPVEECVTNVVKAISFPKPKGSASVKGTLAIDLAPAASGSGSAGKTPPSIPMIGFGDLKTEGDLDKTIVRRYLKRHYAKFLYCYEKQLVVDKTLAGSVTATFAIDAQGKVSSASATGIKSKPVEDCVAAVVKSIEFPAPKSGTVKVTQTFDYSPTGG